MNKGKFIFVKYINKVIKVFVIVLGIWENGFWNNVLDNLQVSKMVFWVSSGTVNHAKIDHFWYV